MEVRFIRWPPPPHSRIERMHPTMERQAILGQHPASPTVWQQMVRRRREFLNGRYPSASLGGKPPLVAFPEARHSGRLYRLE
ncbi:MAG: hypothetical protein ACPLYD_15230 [Anaerolineae bacterium]